MDFSFADGDFTAAQAPPPAANRQGGAARRPIGIPSYSEVQAAQQPRSVPNLFRPSGLVASVINAGAPAHPSPVNKRPRTDESTSGSEWSSSMGNAPRPRHSIGPAPALGPGAQHGSSTAPAALSALSRPAPLATEQWHIAPGQSGPGRPLGGIAVRGPPTLSGSSRAQPYQGQALVPLRAGPPAAPPSAAAVAAAASGIVVSRRQQGNPVLKHIRNVRWAYGDIVPDYQLGHNTAALFLSLRYHLLHPEYILHRLKQLLRSFRVTVLLVHVDVDDMVEALCTINKAAIANDATLMCAWTVEECARYLETYKSYETKPATSIQERVEGDYASRVAAALTCVRGVTRGDAVALTTRLGSLAEVLRAGEEQLQACPGVGPAKVRRLMEALHEPFRKPLRTPITLTQAQPHATTLAPFAAATDTANAAGAAAATAPAASTASAGQVGHLAPAPSAAVGAGPSRDPGAVGIGHRARPVLGAMGGPGSTAQAVAPAGAESDKAAALPAGTSGRPAVVPLLLDVLLDDEDDDEDDELD